MQQSTLNIFICFRPSTTNLINYSAELFTGTVGVSAVGCFSLSRASCAVLCMPSTVSGTGGGLAGACGLWLIVSESPWKTCVFGNASVVCKHGSAGWDGPLHYAAPCNPTWMAALRAEPLECLAVSEHTFILKSHSFHGTGSLRSCCCTVISRISSKLLL